MLYPTELQAHPTTLGGAVTHVWPPQLLVQIGPMIVQPGEGVLKSVKRFGNRLSLTVEHEGQEAWGGVEVGAAPATVGGRCRESAQGQRREGDYGDRRPRHWLNHRTHRISLRSASALLNAIRTTGRASAL
jgi:hypothetical protein